MDSVHSAMDAVVDGVVRPTMDSINPMALALVVTWLVSMNIFDGYITLGACPSPPAPTIVERAVNYYIPILHYETITVTPTATATATVTDMPPQSALVLSAAPITGEPEEELLYPIVTFTLAAIIISLIVYAVRSCCGCGNRSFPSQEDEDDFESGDEQEEMRSSKEYFKDSFEDELRSRSALCYPTWHRTDDLISRQPTPEQCEDDGLGLPTCQDNTSTLSQNFWTKPLLKHGAVPAIATTAAHLEDSNPRAMSDSWSDTSSLSSPELSPTRHVFDGSAKLEILEEDLPDTEQTDHQPDNHQCQSGATEDSSDVGPQPGDSSSDDKSTTNHSNSILTRDRHGEIVAATDNPQPQILARGLQKFIAWSGHNAPVWAGNPPDLDELYDVTPPTAPVPDAFETFDLQDDKSEPTQESAEHECASAEEHSEAHVQLPESETTEEYGDHGGTPAEQHDETQVDLPECKPTQGYAGHEYASTEQQHSEAQTETSESEPTQEYAGHIRAATEHQHSEVQAETQEVSDSPAS